MKKRIFALLLILSVICMYNRPITVNAAVDDENDIQRILQMVNEPEPIGEIVNGNVNVSFTYDENKHRVKKVSPDGVVSYVYANDLLVGESGKNNIQFNYSDVEGDVLCTEVIINGEKYFLQYDKIGNVSNIYDDNNICVCHYEYNNTVPLVYECANGEFVLNNEEEFIGNMNPFRYQGWYYDMESKHYHLGKGIYYDVENSLYVNNPYTVNVANSARSSEPAILRTITQAYSIYLSSATFGATDFNAEGMILSRSEWLSGKRWYDGLNQTEVMARCLYGENTRKDTNGPNDRVAVTVLIMNRVNDTKNFQLDTSSYVAVTRAAQFSSINPGTYEKYLNDTENARLVMNKTDTPHQEAILLACAMNYTTDLEVLRCVRTIPAYIKTQTSMLGLDYVYKYGLFSISGGMWFYNGKPIWEVALAGEVLLPTTGNAQDILRPYYGDTRYNVFFQTYENP